MQIKDWVADNRDSMLETAMELIRIRSVSEKGTDIYPYGEGCARVLDKALALGREMGFETENHEYHCGSILLPGRTDKEIGIFVHLDVVHEGSGWKTNPYEPVIKDGWLYGRGSADDKGPAAAALYCLKYLKEQGIILNHRIRLYLGCSEERGMEDIAYYIRHYKAPDFSFTPDGAFPVCYAEKGIIEGEFSCRLPFERLMGFQGGVASNAVPSDAWAVLSNADVSELKKYVNGLKNRTDFSLEELETGLKVKAVGKSAHAAFPEGSDSASVKLCHMIYDAGILTEEETLKLRFMDVGFAGYFGEGMGVECEDEQSGRLTLIGGMARVEEDRLIQNFNIRYCVSADVSWIHDQLTDTARQFGWKLDWFMDNPPCMIEPDSEVIKVLTDICTRVWKEDKDNRCLDTQTGKGMEPYSMGGGTYARKLPNAVAFGPGIRGQKKPCPPGHGGGHQPDECIRIENLTNAMEIYIEALQTLDKLV